MWFLLALLTYTVSAQDLSCDAGLFIPEQAGPGDWLEPVLPIESYGVELEEDGTDCENFPDSGSCPDNLVTFADNFLAELSLADPNDNNQERTNGYIYCQFLSGQIRGNNKMINGTNLVIYGRVNACGGEVMPWNTEREFGRHTENLCCDSEGTWVPECPLPMEFPDDFEDAEYF